MSGNRYDGSGGIQRRRRSAGGSGIRRRILLQPVYPGRECRLSICGNAQRCKVTNAVIKTRNFLAILISSPTAKNYKQITEVLRVRRERWIMILQV